MQVAAASIEAFLPILYRSATDPRSWQVLLSMLCTSLKADTAVLAVIGPQQQILLSAQHGMDDALLRLFLEHLPPKAGGSRESLAARPDAASGYKQARNEFAYPQQIEVQLPGTEVYARASLSVLRTGGGPPFRPEQSESLQQMAPHLSAVLNLWHPLEQVRQKSALLEHLSHGFDLAYMLLDGKGRPLLISDAADNILQRKDGLSLEHGTLCTDRQQDQAELSRLLTQACVSDKGHAVADEAILVHRRTSRPLYLLLRSLPTAGAPPCALAVLHDPDERPAPRTRALRLLYRLLPSEIRLAEFLAAGLDVKQAAAGMHITENSARTLLKSVFRKTGVSSQAGLLRSVLSLPAD